MQTLVYGGPDRLALAWMSHPSQQAFCSGFRRHRRRWLVTGAAGFIGSHLVEALLLLDQDVRGVDNFATGSRSNLKEIQHRVGPARWRRFSFLEMDIRDAGACHLACSGVEVVLHQAALSSVPLSIDDPAFCYSVNVCGFANMLRAAGKAQVGRFVYASSSAVYGDDGEASLKREDRTGLPLSPYAAAKAMNETHASACFKMHGLASTGLRYFNIFGPRQTEAGDYAAVIPKWIGAMIAKAQVQIYGDGETRRDFCHVGDVVQANLRAALLGERSADVYNIAVGESVSLNRLFLTICDNLAEFGVAYAQAPRHEDFRTGDLRQSQADISKAVARLGYVPTYDLRAGMKDTLAWRLNLPRRNLVSSAALTHLEGVFTG